MTDCKSPLEIIMSHDYCFGDLREELEKWKGRKFPYRDKVKNLQNHVVLQVASPNGHLCHIRRTARDIISGQTGTH